MRYRDRLYGEVKIEKLVEELLYCKEIQRLNHISLSSVPNVFLVPHYFKDMASRLEHSIGMCHLVSMLCGFRLEFKEFKNALLLAAICHDAGTPPFSHNSEYLLEKLTKMNHEQYTERFLKNSMVEEVIKKYGFSLREIAEVINGKSGIAGRLMNNTIDIDNADNTERYGFSSGRIERISSPEKLVKAFMLKNNELRLDSGCSEEIKKWKECRRRVYREIVYSDMNLSAGSMLHRALGFIYEEKGKELLENGFLMLTDDEALQYMEKNSCNAKILIERARNGNLHKKVAGISSVNPSKKMEEFCKNWKGRIEFADCISEKFGLQRHDVSIQAFVHKHERYVNNFYPPESNPQLQENHKTNFDIRVFINPEPKIEKEDMQKFINKLAD